MSEPPGGSGPLRRDGVDASRSAGASFDLGAHLDMPPAYGACHDQLQLTQAGFEAGAAVTDDGRVDINIHQTGSKFADLLAPALRTQTLPSEKAKDARPSYALPSRGGQPTLPKLNVVVHIVGSRGDVQPFVALGKTIRDTYGHRVRIATHPTFKAFVEENDLEFFSIGGDPAELMAFMVKNPGLMPGFDALKQGEVSKRRKGIEQILLGCWRSCIEPGDGSGPPLPAHRRDEPMDDRYLSVQVPHRPFVADVIIANPPSFAHIHVAEKLGIPLHMMFTMPWSPTKAFPHPLANIQSSNTDEAMTDYVSYALVEMMTWQGLGDVINRFRTSVLDLDPLSLIWAPGLLARLRIPTTYCWSPALIPKPNDWGVEISIAGFYFLNLASSYTPEPALAAFLADGPPPVYIGFGSIVVDDPNALTRLIFDAISIAGVRALVSKGWGGIGADSVGIPDGVFMLGNCPHDWLFQHVSCVVHHGGAGTTAAGIKLGKPTVVVPFFGDQPFWGSMIARAGAGPEPIPYSKLTAEKLAASIREALKPATLTRAEDLGAKIREEQGTESGGKSFHDFLDCDRLRCSLVPDRVAVWRVRRSKIKLSALAASVLLKEGILSQGDLKLYRPKEYVTDGQPWDPISAVTAALLGDVGSIAMAITDLPRELFKGKSKASVTSETQSKGHISGSSSSKAGSQTDAASVTTSTAATTAASDSSGTTPAPHPSVTINTAIDASKGVARIVDTGIKTPMNVCLGLARGFRNLPKLYNDETVRPQEKVTDLNSGLKVAGKEFGLGLYDGLSGLITQPLKGARKEGGIGAVKGLGKGIGGLILKPAAGAWSIPAYTMQGISAEFRNRQSSSWQNYIIASRLGQGMEDLGRASSEQQEEIIIRWVLKEPELKGFYQLNHRSKDSQGPLRSPSASPMPSPLPSPLGSSAQRPATSRLSPVGPSTGSAGGKPDRPPETGIRNTWKLSFDERKQLHAQRDAWMRKEAEGGYVDITAPPVSNSDEMERAIRESVQQTSRGNAEEDARVEQAIRTSVGEMHMLTAAAAGENDTGNVDTPTAAPAVSLPTDNISDEEYQVLVEEAVKQSLQAHVSYLAARRRSGDSEGSSDGAAADEEELFNRAIRESIAFGNVPSEEEMDEDLKRALQESESAHREQQRRDAAARTEEVVVLEYVKKQSLMEEEYRKQKEKGKAADSRATSDEAADEAHDESKPAPQKSLGRGAGQSGGPCELP